MMRHVGALALVCGLVTPSDAFTPTYLGWTPSTLRTRQSVRTFEAARAPAAPRLPTACRATTDEESGPAATTSDDKIPSQAASSAASAKDAAPSPEDTTTFYSGLVGGGDDEAKLGRGRNGDSAAITEYPINLPSYLLLLLATVGCIAFVGSIFEVTGPNPELGYTPTYIIGTLSLPTFIFLFYAAIKKGQAEVEEDDARYRGGRW